MPLIRIYCNLTRISTYITHQVITLWICNKTPPAYVFMDKTGQGIAAGWKLKVNIF